MPVKYVTMPHCGKYHRAHTTTDIDTPELRDAYMYELFKEFRCSACGQDMYYWTGTRWNGDKAPHRRVTGDREISKWFAYKRDYALQDLSEHNKKLAKDYGVISVQVKHENKYGTKVSKRSYKP